MTGDARTRPFVIALADVARDAEIPFVQHRPVVDPSRLVAPGRTAAGEIHMHVLRMRSDGWLGVTGQAVAPGPVVVGVAAGALRLCPESRITGVTRGA